MTNLETIKAILEIKNDGFDAFKQKYAFKESYVAAMFVHSLLNNKYTTLVVSLKSGPHKNKLRKEIFNIIDRVPKEFISNKSSWSIKSELQSKILFCNEWLIELRGINIHMLYTLDEVGVLDFSSILKPSDIPNLYISRFKKEE